jgi:hypothetical protein
MQDTPLGLAAHFRTIRWWKVEEDSWPLAFNFIHQGVQVVCPFAIYENPAVYPRAFVVGHARPLPERAGVLAALESTDFHQTVLLEGIQSEEGDVSVAGAQRAAAIADYRPNRVAVHVEDGPAGFLVLTDIWYPGWTCSVDGQAAELYRANFLFRAVRVPSGAHDVVFAFVPQSYYWGRIISGAALLLLSSLGLFVLVRQVTTYRTR